MEVIAKWGWRGIPAFVRDAACLTLMLMGLAALGPLASPARAYIYWGNGSINSADLDGSNLQLLAGASGQSFDKAAALVSDGTHLYFGGNSVGTSGIGTIARINPDGSGLSAAYMTLPKATCATFTTYPEASAIAVDGSHIYWADAFVGTIGRANIDGSSPVGQYILAAGGACGTVNPGGLGPEGLAVVGAHIYWTNSDQGTIGRANLDGTGPTQFFITGAQGPWGIAVAGSNVYWTNTDTGTHGVATIGHAQLDGSGALIPASVNQSFITGLTGYHGDPLEIGAFGGFIYFDNGDGWIGRANLDGTDPINHFLQTGTGPQSPIYGLALDSLQANATTSTLACSPSSLQLLYPLNDYTLYAPVNDTSKCTVTVSDNGASPRRLTGVVNLSQSPVEGAFTNGGADGSAQCTLTPSAAPGRASCSFKYQTAAQGSPATSTLLTASYAGQTTHAQSTATHTIALQKVHACHLVFPSEGDPYYPKICVGSTVVGGVGGGGGGGGGGATRSKTVGVGGGSITVSVPRGCVAGGTKLLVKLAFKPGKGKKPTFLRVYRAVFSLGSGKPVTDKHSPFLARLKVRGGHHRTLTVTTHAMLLLTRGKRLEKTLKLTITTC